MTSQLTEIALQMLGTIERMELIIPEITDIIRKALEEKAALAAEQEPPATAFVVATDKELLEFAGERFPYALRSCYDLGRQHGATLAVEPEPAVDGEVAELVAWLHGQDGGIGRRATYSRIADLLLRLASQSVSEGPTDEELDELFTEIDQGGEALAWRAYARAVLARWGQP